MKTSEPIKFEDLNLSEEDMKEIADGARRFLDPGPDPTDGDIFYGVDEPEEPETV